MKVTVSVLGRFHAFYLARELERRGHLRSLITSHPAFNVSDWGVSGDLTDSLWPVEVARQTVRRLPAGAKNALGLEGRFHELYGWLAARRIPEDSDLFVGWSHSARRGIDRAHELGIPAIVERCSSHIAAQCEILAEEFERHGIEPVLPSDAIIEKELEEYESADYVAVPSSFVEKTFRDRGIPANRLRKIPYGVDPAEFEPVDKEDDLFRVVFAGQLAHRKGIPYLLQAWRNLALPESELLLLGPVRDEFRPWMEKYRGEYRHPGSLPQRELYRWYSQGSVFVLPSVEEGMAYVQLQAMCCGLPLICTPNTGGEDLIREGEEGFVVPIRDVEALEERLEWCYEHREACRSMGRSARQRVLRHFTWRDYGDRIVRVYRGILDGEATPDA